MNYIDGGFHPPTYPTSGRARLVYDIHERAQASAMMLLGHMKHHTTWSGVSVMMNQHPHDSDEFVEFIATLETPPDGRVGAIRIYGALPAPLRTGNGRGRPTSTQRNLHIAYTRTKKDEEHLIAMAVQAWVEMLTDLHNAGLLA